VIGQDLGPYHIVSKLGSGGMGDVWLATETSLGRKVALKLLPDGQWLTFVYIDTQGLMSGIAVARSEGADPSAWIRLPGEMLLDKPRWAHDGRSLYFIGRRARSYSHLFRIGFDTAVGRFVGAPEQLSDFSRPDLEITRRWGAPNYR
jgi:hypothetical protein